MAAPPGRFSNRLDLHRISLRLLPALAMGKAPQGTGGGRTGKRRVRRPDSPAAPACPASPLAIFAALPPRGPAMLRLYDNAFSPFARKLRLVMDHKGSRLRDRGWPAQVHPCRPGRSQRPGGGAGPGSRRAAGGELRRHRRLPGPGLPQSPVLPDSIRERVRARAWEGAAAMPSSTPSSSTSPTGPGPSATTPCRRACSKPRRKT